MSPELPHYNLYLNGQWRAPRSEQYEPTYNPANSEAIAYIAKANAEDTREAVAAARRAFDDGPWIKMSPGERSRLLHKIVDALEEHQEELADLDVANGGSTWRKAHQVDLPAISRQ